MKVILLLCLLTLGNGKLYQPFNIASFLKSNEIMMADSEDDDDDDDDKDDDDDDKDDDDDDYEEDENCPSGCHCSPKVLQCSDQGERTQSPLLAPGHFESPELLWRPWLSSTLHTFPNNSGGSSSMGISVPKCRLLRCSTTQHSKWRHDWHLPAIHSIPQCLYY